MDLEEVQNKRGAINVLSVNNNHESFIHIYISCLIKGFQDNGNK